MNNLLMNKSLKKSSLERKIGASLAYINLALSTLFSFFLNPIIIGSLGPKEHGLLVLAQSTLGLFSILTFGLGNSYIKFYSQYNAKNDNDFINRLNGFFLMIFLTLGFFAFFLGTLFIFNVDIFFSNFTSEEIELFKTIFLILLLNLFLSFCLNIFTTYIFTNEKFIFERSILLLSSILNPLMIIIGLALGFKSIYVALTTVILTFIFGLIKIFYAIFVLNFRITFKSLEKSKIKLIFSFSFFVFLNIILQQFSENLPAFMVGIYFGTIEVSIVGLSKTFYNYFSQIVLVAYSFYLPFIHSENEKGADSEKFLKILNQSINISVPILIFILFSFVSFGESFISFFLDIKIYSSAYLFSIIMMVSLIFPLSISLILTVQEVKSFHYNRTIILFFSLLFQVFFSVFLFKFIGIFSIPLSHLFTSIVFEILLSKYLFVKTISININNLLVQIFYIIIRFIPLLIISIFIRLVSIPSFLIFLLLAFCYTLVFLLYYIFFIQKFIKTSKIISFIQSFLKIN
jgi:O-antigen/teichoic acid export membrane protein